VYANWGLLGAYFVESNPKGPWQIVAKGYGVFSTLQQMRRGKSKPTGRLGIVVEMPEDASKIRIVAKVPKRSMSARDEYTGKRREFLIRDAREWTGIVEIILALHLLDELVVTVLAEPVAKVGREGRLREGVDVWTSALWRGEL
jgi:hypothetical protein